MSNKKRSKRTKNQKPNVKGGELRENSKQAVQDNQQTASLYATNSRLVEDAGKLAFAQALGNSYSLGSYATININNRVTGINTDNYMAGIVRIGLRPSYGGTLTPTSPLNMATRHIYSFVRHANSGRANYEAADLMLYLLQMNEVLKLYSWFVRLYGICRTYNHKNRYYPKRIVEAMGVDFEDLIKNLASLRFQINVFAAKVNSLNIPMNMPLFKESIYMYSNLYLDGTDEKAQTYFFDPVSYYEYQPVESTTGGMLKEVTWTSLTTNYKVSDLIDKLNSLLFSILQDEDMNIMSGDILKAYGSENMLRLPQLPEDYMLYPIYDEMVLTQIQNMSITNRDNADITQEDQLLVSNPVFFALSPANTIGKLLSFRWDNPTPEQVISATRLSIITPVTETAQSDNLRIFRSITGDGVRVVTGTHIVASLHVICGDSSSPLLNSGVMISKDTRALLSPGTAGIVYPTQFNYFPIRYVFLVDETNASYDYFGVIGDVQNYTILSKEDLDKQHEVALLSLFGI